MLRLVEWIDDRDTIMGEDSSLNSILSIMLGMQISVAQQCTDHIQDSAILAFSNAVTLRSMDRRAINLHTTTLQRFLSLVVLLTTVCMQVSEVVVTCDDLGKMHVIE